MKRLLKYISIIILLLFVADAFAQKVSHLQGVSGRVINAHSNSSAGFATVYFHELKSGVSANENGKFLFDTRYMGKLKITVNCLGYIPLDTLVTLPLRQELLFRLIPFSYQISDIVVSAREGTKGNSVSRIEKSAMKHIQPSSLADIIQLLPGHTIREINLTQSSFISMRQAGSDVNTSLGTSFEVDGTTISNEANLQAFYSSGIDNKINTRITTSSGIDMRTISPDRIESVEIIRGIPSVKHGDITAGVVKIELKSGYTPWEARMKADIKNKLFAVGKGFTLPGKGGTLNIDLDHATFRPDLRSTLDNYSRSTGSVGYNKIFKLSDRMELSFKPRLEYTGSFDRAKTDPNSLSQDDYMKSDFQRVSFSARGGVKIKESFVKEVNYNVCFSSTKDRMERVKWMSNGGITALTSTSMIEGAYDTEFLPAEYSSKLIVDGNPINVAFKFDLRSEAKHGNIFHSLLYGVNYFFDKNLGRGEIYDQMRPYYVGSRTTRPRAFNDVPAMQKLSLYVEDNIRWKIGESILLLQPGVRVTTLSGMEDKYAMKGNYYWEPRVNGKFTFPAFNLADQKAYFSIMGGVGLLYKFPTVAQLYPSNLYFDYSQLNYFPQNNPDHRFVNVQTYITDPTNSELKPSRNLKKEIGISFRRGDMSLDVTFFDEKMTDGFSSANSMLLHQYRYYDASSVIDPSTRPNVDDFTYTNERVLVTYGRTSNSAEINKRGIEYTVHFGKIKSLYTDIWMNGAWFETEYKTSGLTYYKPGNVINNRPYPYVGVYDYTGQDNRKSQFNTNLNFDTHIPMLKMIFSTTIQTMWFETRQTTPYSGLPVRYIDNDMITHEFTAVMADDNMLKHMVDYFNTFVFTKNKVAIASAINMKLSKEIGQNIRLSVYFNNLLNYLPEYTTVYGTKVSRSAMPYFGAELNIKF